MKKSKEQCTYIISQYSNEIEKAKNSYQLLEVLKKIINDIYESEFSLLYFFDSMNKEVTLLGTTTQLNNPLQIKDSILEQVLLLQKGLFTNDVMIDKNYKQEIDNPLNIKVKSMLLVPVFDTSKHLIGFLSVLSRFDSPKEFERYETRTLMLLNKISQKVIALAMKEGLINKGIKVENKSILNSISNQEEKNLEVEILEKKLKLQLKKVKELEQKLATQETSFTSENRGVLVVNRREKIEDNKMSGLKQVLDFLTNEVTYLSNEEHEIYLFLEIIKNSLHNREQLDFIESKLKKSYLISNLVNELYTREKMPMLIEPFNSFKTLSSISSLYYRSFLNKNITFNIFLDPNLPLQMVSDVAKLKSLIIHLMNNIYTFSSKNGVVNFSVTASTEREILDITIQSSTGNSAKNIKKFFQNKEINHGIVSEDKGLGLSVATNLISMLGGKLKLMAEGKEEHTFRVLIPISSLNPQNIEKFVFKNSFKIAILMNEENKYAYLNLKKYLDAFNISDRNIFLFQHYKKIDSTKFDYLFCFENMIEEKFNMNSFPSVTILKYREEPLEKKRLKHVKVNELMINAYYGMALQKIIFPNLPAEDITEGTLLIKDSFLIKFENMVNRLKHN